MTRMQCLLSVASAVCLALTPTQSWALFDSANPAWMYVVDPSTTPPTPLGSSSHPINVTGSFSSSVSGFAPGGSYVSQAVTGTSANAALPTGTVAVFYNTGANSVAVALSTSAISTVTMTTGDIIQPNSWMAFTVGSNTRFAVISGSTSSVIVSGGAGLPTGSGGGSAGGGGGGAVTMASGAVASGAYASGALAAGSGADGWNVTEGTKADTAWTSGAGSIVAILKTISGNTGGAIPAGTNTIGAAVQVPGSSSQGWTPVIKAALTNSAVSVDASAGQLGLVNCDNGNASTVYVEFFNTATVTLGTTAPTWFTPIPAGGGGISMNSIGVNFSTAIYAAAVTTYNGSTAPGTTLNCSFGIH